MNTIHSTIFFFFEVEVKNIEEDRKSLQVRILYDDRNKLLHYVNLIKSLNIEEMQGQAYFSQNPGMSRTKENSNLQFLTKFSSRMDRTGLEEARKLFRQALPSPYQNRLFTLLTSMCQANMKLEFDNLSDFIYYLNESNSIKRHGKIDGWASLRNFSLPFIKKSILDNPDVPVPVKQTYYKSLSLLEGNFFIFIFIFFL